jgi:hypothetical protein
MRCPDCGRECEPGAERCPACDAELIEVETPPAQGGTRWVDFVTVLETADPSLLLVAKSLLDAEHLPCVAEGEGAQEGLGAGRVAAADVPLGPGRIRVRPEDVEAASELLASLQPGIETDPPEA